MIVSGVVGRPAERAPALVRTMLAVRREGAAATVEAAGRAVLGASGDQAAACRLGDLVVAIDGHVYNADELGTAASVAHLVAAQVERHGFEPAVRRLDGDFAIAAYDAREDVLWLARDRFGVRPLYYVAGADWAAFGSRPRALLALPGVPGDVDRRFLALFVGSHYRYFDNDPERSPYAAIRQVPAAHVVRIAGGAVARTRYWNLGETEEHRGSERALAEAYRALLLDAVSRRLAVARAPAFTLSGGMDSSSVLASAATTRGARQHAFSVVYDDKTFDESDDIKPMLDTTVAAWHPVRVGTPDVFATVRRMIEAHDEPVATATWLSHYLLCGEAAREGFGSLFGGLGGDELNAGEYEYFLYHFADLRAAGREDELGREIECWARHHDHPIYRKSAAVAEAALERLVDPQRPGHCRPDRGRMTRYAAALEPDAFDWAAFEPAMDHPFSSHLKNRTYQDIFRETAPCCLRAEDRQSKAFGLDHFLPFFDHRLVEFMFRVAGSLKIRAGVTKHLLREAMRGILPEETRTRVKKTGWNAPAHVWFVGVAKEQLRDLVATRAFREAGIYRTAEIHRLIDEHERIVVSGEPRENHMMFLWQVMNVGLWLIGLGEGRRGEEERSHA